MCLALSQLCLIGLISLADSLMNLFCFIFCTINRLANTFDFELANEKSLNRVGFVLYNLGYGIGSLPG